MTEAFPSDPGPNILLMGESGAGKTYSIKTLIAAGIEVRGIFTEPRYAPLRSISCADGFHLATCFPTSGSWDALSTKAENLTTKTWEQVLKIPDKDKRDYTGMINLISLLHNFKCERCDEEFGDASTWDNSKALVIDSLSGLNHLAFQAVVGGATIKTLPQWGAAMDLELQLINKCCYDTQAWFVLVSHLERLVDEVQGGTLIQVSALGRKNAPEIPKNFDDVILAIKTGDKFTWSTASKGVATKPTYLPLSDTLPPSFATMVDAWKKGEAN